MPIPSILQKTRPSDSICNSFSRRKILQIHYNLVSANSQNLSDNKIFEQKMSDSNCDSPSQGECVPITPHPLYNLLNGTRTHTGTNFKFVSSAYWDTRSYFKAPSQTRTDSFDITSIALYHWSYRSILYQMSTIQYKLWTLFLRVNLLSNISDTRYESRTRISCVKDWRPNHQTNRAYNEYFHIHYFYYVYIIS